MATSEHHAVSRTDFGTLVTACLLLAFAVIVLAVRVLIMAFGEGSDWVDVLFAVVAGVPGLIAAVLLAQLSLRR